MSRPSKYDDVNLILVEGWARDGLTDHQIAHNLGINVSTLYEWKKKHKEFSDTLKKGKEVVDIMVENALLKQALEGNTTAQIFWLKNRKPDAWREKQEIKQEVDGTLKVTLNTPTVVSEDKWK